MINSQPASERPLGAPEITPLIDIVLIVVVFLLLTANTPLLTLPIAVPDADQDTILNEGQKASFVVTITQQKPYWHIRFWRWRYFYLERD